MTITRAGLWAGAAAALLTAGCGGGDGGGGGGTGPVAGVLSVSAVNAAPGGGALMLQVTGGPVDAVEAVAGYRVFSAGTGPTSVRIIVTGNVAAGPLVRLHVPDTRNAARYTAVVEQASARAASSYAAQQAGGYTLAIAVAP